MASIVRVSYVKAMQNNPDVTWTQASAAVWSCLELNLGILCNCLALLKPFVRRHMPFLAGSGGDTGAAGTDDPTAGGGKSGGQIRNGNNSQGSNASFAKRNKKPWDRMVGGKHSYQLHSVGKPSDDDVVAGGRGGGAGAKGIVVVDQFEVDVEYRSGKDGDGLTVDSGSTDSILGPARSGRRAV